MNVSLTPELEDLVRDKVKSGRYGSATEVVGEALRLMIQRDDSRNCTKSKFARRSRPASRRCAPAKAPTARISSIASTLSWTPFNA